MIRDKEVQIETTIRNRYGAIRQKLNNEKDELSITYKNMTAKEKDTYTGIRPGDIIIIPEWNNTKFGRTTQGNPRLIKNPGDLMLLKEYNKYVDQDTTYDGLVARKLGQYEIAQMIAKAIVKREEEKAAPAAQASGKRTRGRPPKKQTKKAKSKITTTKKTEKQPVTKSKYLII